MKGGQAGQTAGHTVWLHPEAKATLSVRLEQWQTRLGGTLDPDTFVLKRRNTANTAISRVQAWTMLTEAFATNGRTGNLGTHGLRKTWASRMDEQRTHDLVTTQRAMGHASVSSTVASLSFREEEIAAAIRAA